MTEPSRIEDWALQAFADGELDASECEALNQRLANDPAARADVEAWRRQKALLKSAFDPVVGEPIPSGIRAALSRHRRRGLMAFPIAAGIALLVIGAVAGWLAAQWPAPSQALAFTDSAILAHEVYTKENRHAVEVAANDSDHLVTWLSRRVGSKLVIPDLKAKGFELLGGRLLATDQGPAAQLMYEDASKRRITVFLIASKKNTETKFLITEKDGVTACYWLDGPLGFVIAGEMPRPQLMELATSVYTAFSG